MVPNEDKEINLDQLRIKKVNKTHHMLIGEIKVITPLGDGHTVLCLAYKKAGNDYKLLPYKVGPTKFCDLLESEKMFYPEIQLVSDFPDLENCPWPAKTYHINGYQPDLSKIPPVADTGDYMVECQFKRGDNIVNGMKVYASVLNMNYG